jgi:hypothetical protein
MSLPYIWRLSFLCCAAFFLIHAALGLAIRFLTPAAIRWAHRMSTRNAARFLFALRMLPLTLSSFAVAALCVPSFLQFEPAATREEVSFLFLSTAALGISIAAYALMKAMAAALATWKFAGCCRAAGREFRVPYESSPLLVVAGREPMLAIAGAFRQQIIVSEGVLDALSADQLEATIQHEVAHRSAADNFKRLLLLLTPQVIPFSRGFSSLDHAWVRFSEFAADDRAVGDSAQRSLTLASALVRVARMGSAPRLSPLCTALISANPGRGEDELSARVDRLLRGPDAAETRQRNLSPLIGTIAAAVGLLIAIAACMPSTLHAVHELLEYLIH